MYSTVNMMIWIHAIVLIFLAKNGNCIKDTCLTSKATLEIKGLKKTLQSAQTSIANLENNLKGTYVSHDSCKKGWTRFRDHCYFFSKTKLDWYAAERFCRSNKASLVNIEDKQENAFIASKVEAGYTAFWIGCHDMKEGTWLWSSDFKAISYSNWEPNNKEPNGGTKENCGHIIGIFKSYTTGTWNDIPCVETQKFVCKRKMKCDCEENKSG